MGLIILIILIILLIGAIPQMGWGYNQNWGNGPSGILGLLLVIVLILILVGYIPHGF